MNGYNFYHNQPQEDSKIILKTGYARGKKIGWMAEIIAYTPEAKYAWERKFVNGEKEDTSLSFNAAELSGLYEVSSIDSSSKENRTFLKIENGQVTLLEQAQAALFFGKSLKPETPLQQTTRRLREVEKALSYWYQQDKIHNDGDGMFDWCNEEQVATIDKLEVEQLKLEATIDNHGIPQQ